MHWYTTIFFLIHDKVLSMCHTSYMCFSFGTILHIFSCDSNTFFLEQSPSWEAKRLSTIQEIFHILWNANTFFFVIAVSEVTHCEMLNFYCNLGVMANFRRVSELLRFFVVTMISSRLGNMSRLSWMLPCLVITVLFFFVYLFKECTVNLEDGCCERVINP